jgi:hypothetical protein
MGPSTCTDTSTNRAHGILRKKPLRKNAVMAAFLLGLITYSLVSTSYTNMLTYVPASASQQNQMNEDANRPVLPTNKSVPEKKDTSARLLLHDDIALQTMEITEANGTVLPTNKPAPKKHDSAPALHDDIVSQANMALEKKGSIPNRVTHLMKKPEIKNHDPYSGMWWVSPVSP